MKPAEFLVLVSTVSILTGCGDAREVTAPASSPPLRSELVQHLEAGITQAGQPVSESVLDLAMPFQPALEFDFDESLLWDVVLFQMAHEPTDKHPDGIAWTASLGKRTDGATVRGGRSHWSLKRARPESSRAMTANVVSGEYEIRFVLVRHPRTVAEKVREAEAPAEFRSVIWSQVVTVVGRDRDRPD